MSEYIDLAINGVLKRNSIIRRFSKPIKVGAVNKSQSMNYKLSKSNSDSEYVINERGDYSDNAFLKKFFTKSGSLKKEGNKTKMLNSVGTKSTRYQRSVRNSLPRENSSDFFKNRIKKYSKDMKSFNSEYINNFKSSVVKENKSLKKFSKNTRVRSLDVKNRRSLGNTNFLQNLEQGSSMSTNSFYK
mmetsp:Transcript_5926/g.5087  ORF Transcript_5926/g.5087 Transcript_5926/m.5087 type:complete len:187 (+) Transcript_5926:847-1407(+)